MSNFKFSVPEPRLRGTFTEVPGIARGVLHALQLAQEDAHKWCGSLGDDQIHLWPAGLPSVAFHLRHIAGSLDRLLTYAEGHSLSAAQQQTLKDESQASGTTAEVLADLDTAFSRAGARVRTLAFEDPALPRAVGKRQLPSTLGGLLVHIADHTQRHAGQANTTAKLVSATKVF